MAYSLIFSTASSKDEAQHIARALVEQKLVACVNIIAPMDSIYRWKGEIESAQEFLLMMKTESERFERVRDAVKSLNSYEVPEVMQVSVENGLPAYLQWISTSIG